MKCECGKEFKKRVHNQKYCSKECADLIHLRNFRMRNNQRMECKCCHAVFYPTLEEYEYCSELCREIGPSRELEPEIIRREIQQLRASGGMRPLPDPDEVECLRCGDLFISENPTSIRICAFCHANETEEGYDPGAYGHYVGPTTQEAAYDRSRY